MASSHECNSLRKITTVTAKYSEISTSKMPAYTHKNTHIHSTPSDPWTGPLSGTWSLRLQLNPKVTGGCENVSTVYSGAFLKIMQRLFTLWPQHGDQLWAGLTPGEALFRIVKYCHVSTRLCRVGEQKWKWRFLFFSSQWRIPLLLWDVENKHGIQE